MSTVFSVVLGFTGTYVYQQFILKVPHSYWYIQLLIPFNPTYN